MPNKPDSTTSDTPASAPTVRSDAPRFVEVHDDVPSDRPLRSPGRLGLTGFVCTLLITLTSAARSWPFPTLTAEPWFFQYSPSNAAIKYALFVLFVIALAGLCWAWVNTLRLARVGAINPKKVWAFWFFWSLPLVFGVPLFSGDVYVYYVDGEAYLRGYNLYESGLSAMGPDSMVHMVHPLWQDTLTMYGPVFLRLAQAVAWVADGNVVAGVLMLRSVVVAAMVLFGIAAVRVAKVFGRAPAEALAFAVLNPLSLLHFVSGAHNDGIMIGVMAAAFAVGITAKSAPLRLLSIFLFALAATVKLPAVAGFLVIGWIWGGAAGQHPTWMRRIVGSCLGGAVGLGFFQALTAVTGLGWGWIHALDVPGLAHPMFSPSNAFAMAFGGIFGVPYGANEVTRVMGNGIAVCLGVFFIFRLGRNATAQQVMRAAGWALLALGWMGPSVYAWYLMWGISLLAITGVGRLRKGLIAVVVIASFSILPGSYGVFDLWADWRRTTLAFILCALFAWGIHRVLVVNGISAHTMREDLHHFGQRVRRMLGIRKPRHPKLSKDFTFGLKRAGET